ncbi:MAG: S8 family serine peptidase, partial [Flavobacteriales bacterium]|nr:S8 family serine peptidase [Flavobacteriales bacterium]
MADKPKSNKPEPISGVLIMKVKPEFRSSCSEMRVTGHALDALFNRIGVQRSSKVFPDKFPESGASKKTPDKRVDLSLIYEVTWSASLSAENVCGQIMATGMVEYAEPRYLPQLLYTPNDPALGGQYEHPLLKSFDAWNISVGDTNVVVGISDTGVDIDHEDLVGNIRYNYNDPINGVDDDGDGYTDNFRGWDLGENDNDPSSNEAGKHHGVFVSGLAGATTDNGLGMAGTGFRCKFLPLKISDKNGGLTRGFESIVYAADHGCAVINCSWGIKGIKSQYGQDIINYAVFNEDALVVAAAGNDNDAIPFYPASFDNVLSVAATGPQDVKWGGSSYGPKVDLSAPGEQVYSTWNGNGYIRSSGTSFSSPITAGCAGVLRSYFPELDVAQVTALLKSTTDFIDTISGNEAYAGYLGTGRLNLYRALTESGGPAIELDKVSVTDMYEDQFQPGDTLYIVASLHNYMAPSDSIHMRIASLSPFASLLDSTAVIAGLNTLGTGSNNADPFVVVISPSAPSNSVLDFMLTYSDTMYESQSPFSVNVNQDYVDITINRVHTSVNGNGNLGFSLPDQQNGLGVIVDQSPNLLYEAGLMIAANGYVSDNRMNTGNNGNESDFYNVTPIKVIPSATAD